MSQKIPGKPLKTSDATKNQLTIIVGLIIIVVAALAIAFGLAAASLTTLQKWAFIAGLIVFPFFSIAIITWLILRHSRKLVVSSGDDLIEWETITPEKQKRRLNVEVRELSKILQIDPDQLSDLRSAYVVAEDLALRKIQNETNIPMMRKIDVGGADFDAVWVDKDLVTCVDVTFVVTPNVDQARVNRVMRKAATAKAAFEKSRQGTKIRLLLVIVTQLDAGQDAELRANVKKTFSPTPVDVDVRFLDFLGLQKTYAED
ncbi:MAG: hypothetical protein R2684_05040 [Pyrinomonadaceae bacterium]